jgi:hypothetical protein
MGMVRLACFLAASLVLLSLAHGARADDLFHRRLKISLGYHFSSGKYGTSNTTDIAYIPLTTKAELGLWTFDLTIPYLRITGSGTGSTSLIEGPSGPIETTSGKADGLGDLTSRGSYTLLPLQTWMPFIDLIGRVKYPTASRRQGLGTGKLDFGFETDMAWTLGRFSPFATLGYRFLGSPSGTHLRDVFLASVGGLYRVLDPLWAGVLLDYREASSSASGERLEVVPFGSWKLDAHWSVDTYVSAGLAKGSPDAGVGLQIGYTL